MALASLALRRLNGWIEPFSYEIRRIERDLEARVLDEHREQLMLDRLACAVETFLLDESFLPVRKPVDLRARIEKFWRAYLANPARAESRGGGFDRLVWLFAIAASLEPELVIESGSRSAASAAALALGAPFAQVHAFGDTAARPANGASNVSRRRGDWCEVEFAETATERALLVFDDGVDQARRVLEAWTRGYRYLVFADNLGVQGFAASTPGPESLPKLAMLFDESLLDGEVLRWTSGGRTCAFAIDRRYFETARMAIRSMQSLPNLADITGGRGENPLTLVELEPFGVD